MDLSKFKHIVTSGCSYGMMAGSISNPVCSNSSVKSVLEGIDTKRTSNLKQLFGQDLSKTYFVTSGDVIVWDFAVRSQSSDWIADSLERALSFLLDKGVPSENIYCFAEWTQWDRISIDKFDWLDIKNDDLNIQSERENFGLSFPMHLREGELFEIREYSRELRQYLVEMGMGTSNGNIGKILDRFYLTPTHTHPDDMLSEKSKRWHELAMEHELSVPTETKIINYLNNIIRTQNLCKVNNIKYNFVFMQESLSVWRRTETNTLEDLYKNEQNKFMVTKDDKLIKNLQYNPTADNKTNIEEVYLPAKSKIKQIDFDNIWFYKNEKFERGGIDEWAIDTFGHGCMVSDYHVDLILNNKLDEVSVHEVITAHGYHPATELYKLIWNESAFNCNFFKMDNQYITKLTKMIWEDLNHERVSKNCLLISKKELERIFPIKEDNLDLGI